MFSLAGGSFYQGAELVGCIGDHRRLLHAFDVESSIECPEELKEAIASVIFAASRYGQLPELQKICKIFIKKCGKELINYANEIRNNCGVNPKIAKKLPTRKTSLSTRLKVLKQIAAEHRITLQLEGENFEVTQEKMNGRKTTHLEGQEPEELLEEKTKGESFSAYLEARNRYKDVKQAAQAAYELATQAAAAAKLVVELSRTKLPDNDPGDCSHQEKHLAIHNENASMKEVKQHQEEAGLQKIDAFEASFRNFCIQMPNKSFRGESKEAGPSNTEAETQRAPSVFTSDSDADTSKDTAFKIPGRDKTTGMEGGSDGKEDESKCRLHRHPWLEQQDWDTQKKFSSFMNEFLKFRSDAGKDESCSNENRNGRSDHPTARLSQPLL